MGGRAVWRGSRSEREQVVMSSCAPRRDESRGRALSEEGQPKLHDGETVVEVCSQTTCIAVRRIPSPGSTRGAGGARGVMT